jgi:hypothetical protein
MIRFLPSVAGASTPASELRARPASRGRYDLDAKRARATPCVLRAQSVRSARRARDDSRSRVPRGGRVRRPLLGRDDDLGRDVRLATATLGVGTFLVLQATGAYDLITIRSGPKTRISLLLSLGIGFAAALVFYFLVPLRRAGRAAACSGGVPPAVPARAQRVPLRCRSACATASCSSAASDLGIELVHSIARVATSASRSSASCRATTRRSAADARRRHSGARHGARGREGDEPGLPTGWSSLRGSATRTFPRINC